MVPGTGCVRGGQGATCWVDPCIQAVRGDPFSFSCTVCHKVVSCKHMGIGDVKRHIQAVGHKKAMKDVEKQSKLSFASTDDPLLTKVSRYNTELPL